MGTSVSPCPEGRVEQCAAGHILCAEAAVAGAGAGAGAVGRGDGARSRSCLATLRDHARGHGRPPLCPLCRCVLPPELQRCLSAVRPARYCSPRHKDAT